MGSRALLKFLPIEEALRVINMYSQADKEHIRAFKPARSFEWRSNAIEDPARVDTWKEELQGIINGIDNIVEGAFCSSIDINIPTSPWDPGFEKPFHQLVTSIAREDAAGGSWDSLLNNGAQRAYLIRGVILKYIESLVFCEPLYGAHSEGLMFIQNKSPQREVLNSFGQAKFRAEQNREYLRTYRRIGYETRNFWPRTDEIAHMIVTMLFPLYNMVEKCATGANKLQSRAQFHQDVHTVVAASAWLSISMRVNPGIVCWKWPKPGDTCDWTQVNADQSMWKASEVQRMAMLDMASVESLATARVKIAVMPEISYNTLETMHHHGMRKCNILIKPTVVYYAGNAAFGTQFVEDRGISLESHVQRVRAQSS